MSVSKTSRKPRQLGVRMSYLPMSNYTRNKNNNRFFQKPFSYKVMAICITHNYSLLIFRGLLGDKWTHLTITDTVSWLLLVKHYIKTITIEVVITTTLSNGSKYSCHKFESHFLVPPIHVLCMCYDSVLSSCVIL